MKKFFTLIAIALVAVSASAQDEYTDLGEQVTNGKIAYNIKAKTDLSQYPADKLVNFVSGEWATGAKTEGTSRVVVDPADASSFDTDTGEGNNLLNYCIEVVSRDAIDPETKEEISIDAWDSRFYVVLPIVLHEGDVVTFSMDIKAEEEATGIGAQAHVQPNEYKDWRILDGISFTTSWANFSKEITITSNQDGMMSFAFDLGATKKANKFYFDNISVKVKQKKLPDNYIDMSTIDWDNANWINLVDNGNCAAATSYSLVCRESGKADAFNRVEGVGKDGSAGAVVTSIDAASQPWDTQFFIYVNHEFRSGEKVKISFDYRSDVAATIPTQTHTTPGNYLGGGEGMVGSLSSTTEWQHYEKVVNAVKGMSTLTFNLNNDKTLATNFYFDNVEMCIAEQAATDEDKEEAAKVLAAKVEDTPSTGISTFKAEKAAKAIYNVAGQQIKDLQKGLNIVDGKKVYVK